jgi:hypothetical protein
MSSKSSTRYEGTYDCKITTSAIRAPGVGGFTPYPIHRACVAALIQLPGLIDSLVRDDT